MLYFSLIFASAAVNVVYAVNNGVGLIFASVAVNVAYAVNNGVGLTPPMSFSTWNFYECDYDETTIRAVAQTMVDYGYLAAGYQYVGMDDCFQLKERGSDGRIQINTTKFPSGFGPGGLTDWIHSLGLKVWLYSDTSQTTCEGYPGSGGNETVDATSFASWGADLLKYDNCLTPGDPTARYQAMSAALNATGRPILFMACDWGTNNPWIELPDYVNTYRVDHDLSPDFNDVLRVLSNTEGLAKYAGPGHWLDMDMMEVGNLGDEDWYTTTHIVASQAHFALWSLFKSALTLGTSVENLQNATYRDILTNMEIIAWNQDPLGIAGDLVWHEGPNRVYAAPLHDGSRAVVLFNSHTPWQATDYNNFTLTFDTIGYSSLTHALVRDVYSKTDLGVFTGGLSLSVPLHGCRALRITPVQQEDRDTTWRPWHVHRPTSSGDM